jgi:conjugative transfer signal peptidase TraF
MLVTTPKTTGMKSNRFIPVLVGLAAAISCLASFGFRFNVTASLPLGVYRQIPARVARGSIVHVCLAREAAEVARKRGYLGPGDCPGGVRSLGKIVLAMEGDIVTHQPVEILINGEPVANSTTATVDSRGRELPHHPWGEHQLRRGELWLFSPHLRNAYDSRYFGPVQRAQVISVLQPIWTVAVFGGPGSSSVSLLRQGSGLGISPFQHHELDRRGAE